jgi:arginase
MNNEFILIGAPSSAGAHAPGQEKAPFLLREAGILGRFAEAGLNVSDSGNLPGFRYKSDPSNPRARNVQVVADNARRVADAVFNVLDDGNRYIVLGGDCTNGAGAIAGATRESKIRTGVIYLDMHGDLNTPESVKSGALDWMGVAHLLGEKGTAPEFANFDARNPVLQNEQIVLLGWDYAGSNSDWERETIIRREIKVVRLEELIADPATAAKRALAMLGTVDRVVVHFDVDVIDFADCPLGESYRHGEGCTLEQAMAAISVISSRQEFAGITVTELNPDHGEEEFATLMQFSKRFAQALAGKIQASTE